MSNPTLRLGPKELFLCAPGTPEEGAATRMVVQIEEQERAFRVRFAPQLGHDTTPERYKFWTFYWLENTEEERLFGNAATVVDKSTNRWTDEKQLARLQKGMPSYLHRFWLSPDASFGLSFASFGSGKIERGHGSRFDEAFNWEAPPDLNLFLDWTELEFCTFCQKIMAEETSDLHFLLNWSTLSDEEKQDVAFSCARGTWTEMCHLLTLVLRVTTATHSTFPSENSDRSMWIFAKPIREEFDSPKTRFLNLWSQLIFDEFQPQFWRDYHLCAHRWRQRNGKDLGMQNEVQCGIPTAHELMEAQLALRQWAQSRVSDTRPLS